MVSLLRREVGSDFLENTRLVIAFCVRGASFRLTYKQHFVAGSGREGTGLTPVSPRADNINTETLISWRKAAKTLKRLRNRSVSSLNGRILYGVIFVCNNKIYCPLKVSPYDVS